MQEIRREVGVSNGSLYHRFPSKAQLVAELLVDGMRTCQGLVIGTLESASSPEDGVRETVRRYLEWVEGHRGIAAVLFADLPDEALLAAEPALSRSNRAYVRTVGAWLQAHMDSGGLSARRFETAHALWLGPAQELSRHWLRGRSKLRPTNVSEDLADGAWCALSAEATSA
jgi:AcrR family transcriptional regulator